MGGGKKNEFRWFYTPLILLIVTNIARFDYIIEKFMQQGKEANYYATREN